MIAKTLCLLTSIQAIECARILGLFVVPSISHQVVYQPIWRELALRGHQVTAMSPDILRENITNLKEIDVHYTYDIIIKRNIAENMNKEKSMLEVVDFVISFFEELIEAEFQHPEIEKLIKGNDEDFDVILVEALSPLIFAIGAKYNVPIIGVSSLSVFLNTYDSVGNPTHPIISPDFILNVDGEMSFWKRMHSFLFNIYYRILYYWRYLPRMDRVARKYFGDDMPYLGDLEKNVSLLLLNTNPLLHTIRPNVPAVVEISQMHIKKKKPLPSDIKQFLDKSKEGVVYFSLGSNVKSANLTERLRNVIIETLRELPYQVLWKWETDHLPGQPKNVKINKWLPQQDVLGHRNIKVFVTQGGIQSIEEAISNEVPMVGMPFIADQPLNIMKLVNKGVARYVDFATVTKEEFKAAILDVAENKKYKENIKEIKTLLTDQPMVGVEKAVWWIEYVIRHKGARHLVSPARDMPLWEYFCLDIIGFLLTAIVISLIVIFKIVRMVLPSQNVRKQKTM